MKTRHADLRSMIRASLAATLAVGLTMFVGFTSHAGEVPTPTSTPTATPTITTLPTGTSTPTASPTMEPTATPTSTTTSTSTSSPTPTAAPTTAPPTPTSTPTAAATATPTSPPASCTATWGVTSITTIGKSNSPANNAKVSHMITGNIIDPDSLCPAGGTCTAQRIPLCTGSTVTIEISGSNNNSNIGKGNIFCDGTTCSVGAMIFTEKYLSVSNDGTDSDRITLLPQ